MTDIFDLRGKVAWVTGASVGGLGFCHAQTLAEEGTNLVISDLSSRSSNLEEAQSKLATANIKVLALRTDVSRENEVRNAVGRIEKEFGRIDILVNNAAISVDVPALEMRLEDWKRVLDVNLTGVWLCSREVCHLMFRKKVKGKIINIASVYGLQADLDPSAPYYATKAAVINLTRALAVEWASYGINVNAIGPGYFFPTGMTKSQREEVKRRYLARIPLRRPGDPKKDLQGALIFLASNASDYMTGQTIFVDGGWTSL